jgi:hypothetical protein
VGDLSQRFEGLLELNGRELERRVGDLDRVELLSLVVQLFLLSFEVLQLIRNF